MMILGFTLNLLAASEPTKSNQVVTSASSTTNAPTKTAPIEIPTSNFIIPTSVADGRNPFFPDSLAAAKASAINTTNTVSAPVVTLDLKGISGRFALINNRTFEAGEEADVTIGNNRQKVHVHCISIREDSVTVEVDGVRRELKLRPGR
jgi:hypothetical protein